ncbi:MAG: hypothetical protein EXX96DRAFT_491413 [Benjaminiella poitrasii]|nr:MAG: hypothetical protein EXX96DRAFT_491413 [Benjaminiella poitrasii]
MGITLRSDGTGAICGKFYIPDKQVQHWIHQVNDSVENWKGHTLQIRLECSNLVGNLKEKNNLSFPPSYSTVQLVEPDGISIISDIDDTIKDTRILSGTRSVLTNTFFNPTRAVTGMAYAYSQWYNQGAVFHYVSNSPFQLAHVLEQFMKDHDFPLGSFHLRDSCGLLSKLVDISGKFKRDMIRHIMRDFPHRKFILVGDSGELDLEIYTRIAIEFPNQVIKIFIRDVTSQANIEQNKKYNKKMRSSTFPFFFSNNAASKQQNGPRRSQSITVLSSSVPNPALDYRMEDDKSYEGEDDNEDIEDASLKLTETILAAEEKPTVFQPDHDAFVVESSPDDIPAFNELCDLTSHHLWPSYNLIQLYMRIAQARRSAKYTDIVLFTDANELLADKHVFDVFKKK